MSSQFFGLMIGYSGLNAAAAAEHTIGHNISNKDTEGYSRQKVDTSAADAISVNAHYGMAGAGVRIDSISQYRDSFVDMKYRKNEAEYSYYSTLQEFDSTLEKYFKDDTVTTKGFADIYSQDFFKALEDLSTNPGSTTTRTAFLGKANALTDYFNVMYENLQKTQSDANYEIKVAVDRINNIAQQIANLNKQINMIEVGGLNANDLRDKRALLVDELSGYVDVETSEIPVIDEVNGNPTGMNIFRVNIGMGESLVSNYECSQLGYRERTSKVNQCDVDGIYDLYWKDTGNSYSPLGPGLSGSLKALFLVRDGNNSENLGGTIRSATGVVDKDAETATVTVDYGNEVTNLDEIISRLNIGESGVIKLRGASFNYTGWEIKFENNKATITFKNLKQDSDVNKKTSLEDLDGETVKVEIGESVDYKGVPYYMSELNQWVRDFARVFNMIEKSGEDLNGDKMTRSFFEWSDKLTGDQTGFDESLTEGTVESGSDSYYKLTAGNFKINKDILKDSTLMSTTTKDGDVDVNANDIVQELISIKNDTSKMKFRGNSSSSFLTIILSDMAFASSASKIFGQNAENMKKALENQRASVSGVDEEDEALDMIKFQKSYNLSSKMISVMAQIYDRLILETGV